MMDEDFVERRPADLEIYRRLDAFAQVRLDARCRRHGPDPDRAHGPGPRARRRAFGGAHHPGAAPRHPPGATRDRVPASAAPRRGRRPRRMPGRGYRRRERRCVTGWWAALRAPHVDRGGDPAQRSDGTRERPARPARRATPGGARRFGERQCRRCRGRAGRVCRHRGGPRGPGQLRTVQSPPRSKTTWLAARSS